MSRSFVCAVLAMGSAVAFAAPQSAPVPSNAGQPIAAPARNVSRSPLKPGDRGCLRDTGSLIKPRPGECLPVAGRSYSKQDIDNTGETTLGPALERLDPAVTVRGGGGH